MTARELAKFIYNWLDDHTSYIGAYGTHDMSTGDTTIDADVELVTLAEYILKLLEPRP